MRLEFYYPLLVRKNGRSKAAQLEYWAAEEKVEVDVAEADDASLPVAFTFKRQHRSGKYVYRIDEETGRLFTPVRKLEHFHPVDVGFYGADHPQRPLWEAYSDRCDELRARPGATVFFPARDPLSSDYFRGRYRLSEVENVNQGDVDHWRGEFRRNVDSLRIIKDWIWATVPEPYFHLYRTQIGWKVELESEPWSHRISSPGYFFSLDRFEEMTAWQAYLAELTGSPASADLLEMTGRFEPSGDGYALDADLLLRDAMRGFESALDLGNNTAVPLASIPQEALELYVRMGRLAAVAPADRSDDQRTEIVALVAEVYELSRLALFSRAFPKEWARPLHAEKWAGRPISLMDEMFPSISP